ncbi:hypothetical protein H4S14_000808 [Agrobacterium vitis]|nr:hypothetical protein [Agrobacterium vitis]MBE1437081.1 hypothetical protein [Agrobacterium vitis]
MKPAFSKKLENWKGKDGFQPPVTLCLNDNPNCAQQKSLFIVEAMYAYGGVYQAQRNLAFCLGNDCFGAVIENKILSCAWRIVILASGHIEADNTDTMNLKICLNKADPVEIASIKTQAAKLYKTVYAKDIGPDWR